MKVLGLIGSPRVGGNTETLVAEVLRGAASRGAQTEQVALNKLNISPCQACDACRKTKRCRIQDDMQALYDKIFEADALVLGTPIYFWGPSAQLKCFVDRWYAIDQEGIRERLAGKKCLLVCAFADSSLATAQPTVDMTRLAVEWLNMQFAEPLLGAGLWEKDDATKNDEIKQRAFRAGVQLI